jgi:type I restriction enzyme, S subunit
VNWPTIEVSKLARIVTKGTTPTTLGFDYSKEGVRFMRAQNLHGKLIFNDDDLFIDKKADEALRRSRIYSGDVLLSIAGTIGRSAVVPNNAPAMNCNQAVAIIRLNHEEIFPEFFRCWLESNDAQQQISGSKVTLTISNLSLTQIKKLKIPLPPMAEQKRIAAILDKADALRQKRKKALERLGDLLQSVFLEMFGDPVKNQKGWEIHSLESLSIKPITYGILKPGPYIENGIPMIRIKDLKNGQIHQKSIHKVSNSLSDEYNRTLLNGGEIVISLVGTIGLVSIIPANLKGSNVHRNLGVICPNDKVKTKYLYYFLSLPHFKYILDKNTKGGIQKLLNLKDLRNINVTVPALNLQDEFVIIAKRIDEIKQKMIQERDNLEFLFCSMQQRAFRGELSGAEAGEVLEEMEGEE